MLDKPHTNGGLELSRYTATAVLAALILDGLLVFPQRAERIPATDADVRTLSDNRAA